MMPIIEIFGIFTKPFALMIRLFANMMAGHAAILSLISIIFITANMGPLINGSMGFVVCGIRNLYDCAGIIGRIYSSIRIYHVVRGLYRVVPYRRDA